MKVQARTADELVARYAGVATVGKGPGKLARAIGRTVRPSLAETAKDSVRLLLYREKAKSKQNKYEAD